MIKQQILILLLLLARHVLFSTATEDTSRQLATTGSQPTAWMMNTTYSDSACTVLTGMNWTVSGACVTPNIGGIPGTTSSITSYSTSGTTVTQKIQQYSDTKCTTAIGTPSSTLTITGTYFGCSAIPGTSIYVSTTPPVYNNTIGTQLQTVIGSYGYRSLEDCQAGGPITFAGGVVEGVCTPFPAPITTNGFTAFSSITTGTATSRTVKYYSGIVCIGGFLGQVTANYSSSTTCQVNPGAADSSNLYTTLVTMLPAIKTLANFFPNATKPSGVLVPSNTLLGVIPVLPSSFYVSFETNIASGSYNILLLSAKSAVVGGAPLTINIGFNGQLNIGYSGTQGSTTSNLNFGVGVPTGTWTQVNLIFDLVGGTLNMTVVNLQYQQTSIIQPYQIQSAQTTWSNLNIYASSPVSSTGTIVPLRNLVIGKAGTGQEICFGKPNTASGARYWNALAASADAKKLVAVASNDYFIYTSNDAGATWTKRLSSSNNWNAVTSSYDGTKLVAVPGNGYLYTSWDSGASWVQRTQGPNTGWNPAIASSADGTKVLAAAVGSIYMSGDSGATWTQYFPVQGQSPFWISAAGTSDLSKIVLIGSTYIYTSANMGVSWTQQTAAGNRQWFSLTSTPNGKLMYASVNNDGLYKSLDFGVTWTAVFTPQTQITRSFTRLAISADGSKLAASGNSYYNGYLYTSDDYGVTYTLQTIKPFNYFGLNSPGLVMSGNGTRIFVASWGQSIYTNFPSCNNPCPAGGYDPTGNFTTPNGCALCPAGKFSPSSGQTSCFPAPLGTYISSAGATGPTACPAGTYSPNSEAKYCTSCPSGYTTFISGSIACVSAAPTSQPTPAPTFAPDPQDVCVRPGPGVSAWSGIAVSGDFSHIVAVQHSNGPFYTSSDMGGTWKNHSAPYLMCGLSPCSPIRWTSVASSINGIRLYAGGLNSPIFMSNNSGASWTVAQKVWSGDTISALACSADGTIVLAGAWYGNLLVSADAGASWTKQGVSMGSRYWTAVTMSKSGTFLVAADDSGYLTTSSDTGVTWLERTVPGVNPQWASLASSADGMTLIAGSAHSSVFMSRDAGVTWTPQSVLGSGRWLSVASSSDGTRLVAADAFPGLIHESIDGGSTWSIRTSAGSQSWGSVALSADGTKLAASVGSWRWGDQNVGNIYTECIQCPLNTYSPLGYIPCTPCPNGKQTVYVGATACTLSPPTPAPTTSSPTHAPLPVTSVFYTSHTDKTCNTSTIFSTRYATYQDAMGYTQPLMTGKCSTVHGEAFSVYFGCKMMQKKYSLLFYTFAPGDTNCTGPLTGRSIVFEHEDLCFQDRRYGGYTRAHCGLTMNDKAMLSTFTPLGAPANQISVIAPTLYTHPGCAPGATVTAKVHFLNRCTAQAEGQFRINFNYILSVALASAPLTLRMQKFAPTDFNCSAPVGTKKITYPLIQPVNATNPVGECLEDLIMHGYYYRNTPGTALYLRLPTPLPGRP